MILQILSINNFRNFSSKKFYFDRRTAITGINGSGKTSIVEAIYYFTNLKSFRTTNDKKVLMIGKDNFLLNIEGERENQKFSMGIMYNDNKKLISINGKRTNRLSEAFGFFISVIFSTYDKLLSDKPAIYRRKFIDRIISTVDPLYFENLIEYFSILKKRNFVLKNDGDKKLLDVYTQQLSQRSVYIYEKRLEFLIYFEDILNQLYELVFEKKQLVKVKYFSSKDSGDYKEYILYERLKKIFPQENEKKRTLLGPHLDDFLISVDNKPISDFGSEGEKTLLGTTLKIAEINIIYENVGEYPVVLIDDAFSELDILKIEKLLKIFDNFPQIIITYPKKWDMIKNYTMIDLDKS